MELYPTLLRAIAVGTFGLVERIGGGLGPQLIILNNIIGKGSAIGITIIIMILSLITGYLFLPETKNKNMIDFCETEKDTFSISSDTLLSSKEGNEIKEDS